MDRSRLLVAVSVTVIFGVTLVSGPVVGAVDLTTPRIDGAVGQGNMTVSSVDAPDTGRIDRGLQSESYYLKVPDARLSVASIEGKPVVTYAISIPGLNYTRSTAHFLSAEDDGKVALSLAKDTLSDQRVNELSYEGTLSVVLRGDDDREIYEDAISVEVTE
jgi:hypothetical protein